MAKMKVDYSVFTDEGGTLHFGFVRDIDLQFIPRVGEGISFCDCCDAMIVEKVIHDARTGEIILRIDIDQLETRAAVLLFRARMLEHGWTEYYAKDESP